LVFRAQKFGRPKKAWENSNESVFGRFLTSGVRICPWIVAKKIISSTIGIVVFDCPQLYPKPVVMCATYKPLAYAIGMMN
jgi:hypothetical protein